MWSIYYKVYDEESKFRVYGAVQATVLDSGRCEATNFKLYLVDLTGLVAGVFPSTLWVDSRRHASAMRFYRNVFNATVMDNRVLSTEHGFRFRVRAQPDAPQMTVRLSLPPRAKRAALARALASGGRVEHRRQGLMVRDPYGVVWMVA